MPANSVESAVLPTCLRTTTGSGTNRYLFRHLLGTTQRRARYTNRVQEPKINVLIDPRVLPDT